MEQRNEYVQPIMLLVDKADPADATDAIRAAATASVLRYALDGSGDTANPHSPVWTQWLSGPFAKSVRRADTKTFDKVLTEFEQDDYTIVEVGKARAAAFRPVPADAMPKPLARLQVAGTQLPDLDTEVPRPDIPVIAINGGLHMSTGKSAAQAAHSLFLHYIQYLLLGDLDFVHDCDIWVLPADEFDALWVINEPRAVITDAGRTEIEPGSVTAFVIRQDRPAGTDAAE